jgi:thiol:disulfide interchange protein
MNVKNRLGHPQRARCNRRTGKWLRVAVLALAFLSALNASATDENAWLTDLSTAQSRAQVEHKLVLLDFTGSDWCPPCKELRKRVLDSPEFLAYAKTNLVLMEVDFPIKKKQTEELSKANAQLKGKFDVEGFPTVILIDPGGKQLLKTVEAAQDTPSQFIGRLEQAKKKAS